MCKEMGHDRVKNVLFTHVAYMYMYVQNQAHVWLTYMYVLSKEHFSLQYCYVRIPFTLLEAHSLCKLLTFQDLQPVFYLLSACAQT